jgi:glycerophosphoryl diester phosphodiesterase
VPTSDSQTSHAARALAASGRDEQQPLRSRRDLVRLVAHRGAGHELTDPAGPPENTLAAVAHGFAAGADAVEVDVWLTADKVPILHHDRTTDRTTDLTGRNITELTWAELAAVDAGSWKSERWASEPVPTLVAAAAEVPAGCGLVIEIEEGPQVVPHLLAALQPTGLADEQIVFISYNYDTIVEMKASAPQHRAYWIVDTLPRWQLGGWCQGHRRGISSERVGYDDAANPGWLAEQAAEAGLDGLDTLFAYPPELPQRIAAAGLDWLVWTANDPRAIDHCIDDGAWAITTDNTVDVARWFASAGIATARTAGIAF